MTNLTDLLRGSAYDDTNYFNYMDAMGKTPNGNLRRTPTLDGSLRIDPNRPLETPERNYIEMESVPQSTVDHAIRYSNRVNYSEMFLSGLGNDVFNKFLSDKGITLPEDTKFDITVDGYGKVSVTGLDDEELTNKLQDAMSYDFPFIHSVLAMFEEASSTIENNAVNGGMGMSSDQYWKMEINSYLLLNDDVSLADLSLDSSRKIQGLSEELYNKIYGSREDMSQEESDTLDLLRDKIVYFLEKGSDNIPTYDVSLTYEKGKISVN